ncbi:hypothetical protein [Nocardia sp. NPDC005745]|uniref:hypothetical protein n=1 Tax=Nocardia sp. NPDC005745 TaxID=3157061 RepID=UPI0033EED63F
MVSSVVHAGSSLLVAVAGVALLAGCGSGSSAYSEAEPTVATISTTSKPAKCPAPSIVDPRVTKELKTALTTTDLPGGACLRSVDAVEKPSRSDELVFLITLDVPTAATPDDLRPIATDIAHVWKESELGQRTSELDVTNWGFAGAKYMDYLIDEDFRNHPWDGTPSREAELAIWTVTAMG